jgi:hypothetical protein
MGKTDEQRLAYAAVVDAIRRGKLPKASTQACVDCGRPAEDWDHYLGYAPAHVLDVQARCKSCHNRRHTTERLAAFYAQRNQLREQRGLPPLEVRP